MELMEADLTQRVLDAAFEVHRLVGPGLLESAYESCLAHEMEQRGLRVARQVVIPLEYKGCQLECGFRADLIVEDQVLLELKSVEALSPVHEAQLMTYLRMTGCRIGFLLNFNVKLLKDGITRRVL